MSFCFNGVWCYLFLTTYAYDALSRPTTIDHASTANPDITYGNDPTSGNRDTVITPAGTYDYDYDALNRVTSVTDPENQTTTFAYDALGHLDVMSRPNGIDTTYRYNSRSFLIDITHAQGLSIVGQYTYQYDDAGNRTQFVDEVRALTNGAGSMTDTFEYDA